MADEWRVVSLDSLGRIVTGKTPPTDNPQNFGGEVPFITPSDMDGRRIIDFTARRLTELGVSCVRGARIPADAVMVSCIGSDMGKVAISADASVTNQQINTVVVEAPNCARYVYYNLCCRQAEMRRLAGGSAVPILNKSTFGRLPIVLPPPKTQRAIASILGALDDKIDLNRRMNDTLEELARTIFKSWFVDFDPVKAKAEGRQPVGMDAQTAALFPSRLVQSELGMIPEGWELGRLDELLVLQRGFDLPAQDRIPGPYPIVAASGPTAGHVEYKVKGPGVITGRSGVLGRVFLVLEDFWPLNTSLWVKEFKRASAYYAYFALQRLDFTVYNAGSAVPTLNRNHVHGLPHVLPPRTLVDRFDGLVEPVYVRKKHNESESQTLAELRDTLLPKLISGELRVPQAEKLVEACL